ncbi:Uncharacterized protein FKW44_018435, partial [Caligus rogercresseyi]
EIIDFFKFPKATVYSITKSFKESEDIKEGFLTPKERLSHEFWPPAALTSTPATTTFG